MGTRPGLLTPILIRRLGAALAAAAAVLAPVLATLWISTPDVADVQGRMVTVTKSHGVVMLKPSDVPPMLADAVVATEDERYYSHHGIDTVGLARAALYDTANLCLCQGGSTITEQLVKELYLNGSDRGYNKVVDMMLALKVEMVLNKPQIMADYLSEIPTGLGRYGVTDAACVYFGAPLDHLTLGQYALLAGVPQAPSIYDPTVNPGAARSRRADVLADMLRDGYITATQAAEANAEPILAPKHDTSGCVSG